MCVSVCECVCVCVCVYVCVDDDKAQSLMGIPKCKYMIMKTTVALARLTTGGSEHSRASNDDCTSRAENSTAGSWRCEGVGDEGGVGGFFLLAYCCVS